VLRGDEVGEAELFERAARVDEDVAVLRKPREDFDLMQERGVLDDQRVRREHGLAQPDRPVAQAAERNDRRASALGAETREGLRVPALAKGRNREHLGGRDDALATAAVNSDLEEVAVHRRRSSGSEQGLCPGRATRFPAAGSGNRLSGMRIARGLKLTRRVDAEPGVARRCGMLGRAPRR
jgi:hypothetical protein